MATRQSRTPRRHRLTRVDRRQVSEHPADNAGRASRRRNPFRPGREVRQREEERETGSRRRSARSKERPPVPLDRRRSRRAARPRPCTDGSTMAFGQAPHLQVDHRQRHPDRGKAQALPRGRALRGSRFDSRSVTATNNSEVATSTNGYQPRDALPARWSTGHEGRSSSPPERRATAGSAYRTMGTATQEAGAEARLPVAIAGRSPRSERGHDEPQHPPWRHQATTTPRSC